MAVIIAIFWITTFSFLREHGFVEGTTYVSVVGGDAHLKWTINNLTTGYNRYIRNPTDNASLMVFYSDEVIPYIFDTRATFTGDLSQGIVSFNLSNVRLSDAGRYRFTMLIGNESQTLGSEVLVIAVRPDTPVIKALSLAAVSEKEYILNCSTVSRSSPIYHNLTMYSYWKQNGVNISLESGYSVNGTILTISSLSRMDNGEKVTCRTFEDWRMVSHESNAYLLNVLYGPENVQVNPSNVLTVNEGDSMNMTCTGECNPPCNTYQWQKDSKVVESAQSFWIPMVWRNFSGVYTCTVINTNISKNATAQITIKVNYGPDVGKITLSPNQTSHELEESSSLSVNCSTVCYPYCQYIWIGPGVVSYGNTGMLSVPEIKRGQAGLFTCKVTNPTIANKTATATITVTVYYGPDTGKVTLSPNETYEIVEFSPLSINCSTDCYPNCQYRWTYPGQGNNGNTGMLSIPQIKRDQAGLFTCTATNPKINTKSATASIYVTVFYGPDNKLQIYPVNTSYRLVEDSAIPAINCTSSCFPSCDFSWTGPVSSVTGVISLGKVNRSMSGNYTCRGQNTKTQHEIASHMVTVIVIYGPDALVLTPNTTEYTLNESNILPNIQCSSECFPVCASYWHKENTKVPGIQADILSLGNVYRNGSGAYICKSENMESNITKENAIHVVVHYPPTVNMESRNGSFNDTGLMINCTAHGIPERYIYSLIHTSLFSGIKIRQIINNEQVSTGVLVHWFSNPSFMDTGVYTCIASNGIIDYRDGLLHKNVSETVWIKGLPNVTSSERDFYAEKGHSGRLAIEFYNSLLNVSVIWNEQRHKTLENSDKYNISVASTNVTVKFYSILIQQPGYIATLEIQNVTEEDFGSYQVNLKNSVGNMAELTLTLWPRGHPDVPKDFHILPDSITTRSVDMVWVSGFHGGSNQTFVIEYKTQMDEGWTNYSHVVFGGMVQNKYFNITVEDLHENTLYFFQMYAWNVFGKSKYSTVVNSTTHRETNKQKITGGNEATIGGAIGASVLLSVMVAVVGMILYRKRRALKSQSNIGLMDNPVYDSSGPLPDPSTSGSATGVEYASVVKPQRKGGQDKDLSNLYAQVDKTKNGKKKEQVKEKHGKTVRGDTYENATLAGRDKLNGCMYENSEELKADENIYENPSEKVPKGSLSKKDGLLYADLALDSPTTRNGKYVIRGLENRIEYAEIAYDKRGEPLPDNEKEK